MGSMDNTLKVIALESSVLSNVASTIKNFFPDLVHNFRNSFTSAGNIDTNEIKLNQVSKMEKELIEYLKKHNYISIMNTMVTVPEGFSAELLQALSVIDSNTDLLVQLITKDVNEFRVYVSTFITNKDTKISLREHSANYKRIGVVIKEINQSFGGLYKKNSFDAKKPLNELVKRNTDIETVFTRLTTTKKKLSQIDVAAVKAQMEDIASLLDTIINMVKENKVENVSPEAINNLAEGTKTMANIAETISATYFRALGIITAIERLPEELINNQN